jgi:hypothetical protein
MAAGFHLVDPDAAVLDRRDAVLDPGREHEVGDGAFSLRRYAIRRSEASDSLAD